MWKRIKRLKSIGQKLDHMRMEGASSAQMRAYLNQEGYTDRHIQMCAQDLVKLGFIMAKTAEALGLSFTLEERIHVNTRWQYEHDRDQYKYDREDSKSMGESKGCAGFLVAFLGLTGLALSIF